MELTDSRRLTGANLLMDGPGAAAEAMLEDFGKAAIIAQWQARMRDILGGVNWPDEQIHVRPYEGGATLAISAPMDALYAATDLVESAWENRDGEIDSAEIERLISIIAEERDPRILALADAAKARGVTLLPDDDFISLGLGANSQSWPRADCPAPEDVNWDRVKNVPVALVTGTNGKSTTVRIAAAIGAAAGRIVGLSSSDWVKAGADIIASGDYSGPEGARLALRDRRVDTAIIETARGGLLRRGLPLPEATACLITNVASDHLGDYGIRNVPDLADVKFIVAKAVTSSGLLILSADDPLLRERAENFTGDIFWYGLSLTPETAKDSAKSRAAFIKDDMMMLATEDGVIPILPVKEFAPGLGGAARYNISNALGAIALSHALGIKPEAMRAGLKEFESTPEDNPGRGNFIELGGIKTLIDFAHNPHGIQALIEAVGHIPANRRLCLLGQAGDRTDDNIRAMTRAVFGGNPDAIIIKELPNYLRGREIGDVPEIIMAELKRLGYPETQTNYTGSELEAVKAALAWARPGDLLVFLVYDQRKEVIALLQRLREDGWQAGDPLPDC